MSDIDYGEFNFDEGNFEEDFEGQGSGEQHFEDDEPRMEATFHEMQEKQIFSEELNVENIFAEELNWLNKFLL